MVAILLTAGLSVVGTAAAPAQALATISWLTWGSKPSGLIAASADQVNGSHWEDSGWVEYAEEPGGLIAWPRGCQHQGCWLRLTGNADDHSPAFSPSGHQVAFVRGDGDTRQLMVLDLRDGAERVLMSAPGALNSPTWGPDEQDIVFGRTDPSVMRDALWRIPATGETAAVKLEHLGEVAGGCPYPVPTSIQRRMPVYSPSGAHLAYVYNANGHDFCFGSFYPTVGGGGDLQPEALLDRTGAPASPFGPQFSNVSMAWTPDEAWILWETDAGGTWLSPRPGLAGSPREFSAEQGDLAWSPDDKYVVIGKLLMHPDGAEHPCLVEVVENGLTLLVPNPEGCFEPPTWLVESVAAQCAPGSCLTGIVAGITGTAMGPTTQVHFTGAVDGYADPSAPYVTRRKAPGTWVVHATNADAEAVVTSVVCDDSDSSGSVAESTATYRVSAGELVTCVFRIDHPDADGDGWRDSVDPCPTDPTNACDKDSDGDGLKDPVDPCPLDATNSCDPKDDPDPKPECHVHNADYEARLGTPAGARMLRYHLYDVAWCRTDGKVSVTSAGSFGWDKTYSGSVAAGMALLGFKIKYKGEPVTVLPYANGAASVAVSGSFSVCATIPAGGPFLKVFNRVLKKVLPDAVYDRVKDWTLKRIAKSNLILDVLKRKIFTKVLTKAEGKAGAISQFIDLVKTRGAALKAPLSALVLDGICVPKVWTPDLEIIVPASGPASSTMGGVSGIFSIGPYQAG